MGCGGKSACSIIHDGIFLGKEMFANVRQELGNLVVLFFSQIESTFRNEARNGSTRDWTRGAQILVTVFHHAVRLSLRGLRELLASSQISTRDQSKVDHGSTLLARTDPHIRGPAPDMTRMSTREISKEHGLIHFDGRFETAVHFSPWVSR